LSLERISNLPARARQTEFGLDARRGDEAML